MLQILIWLMAAILVVLGTLPSFIVAASPAKKVVSPMVAGMLLVATIVLAFFLVSGANVQAASIDALKP